MASGEARGGATRGAPDPPPRARVEAGAVLTALRSSAPAQPLARVIRADLVPARGPAALALRRPSGSRRRRILLDGFVADEEQPFRRPDCELRFERADRRPEPELLRFEAELAVFFPEFPDLAPEFPCAIWSPSRKRASGRSVAAATQGRGADGFPTGIPESSGRQRARDRRAEGRRPRYACACSRMSSTRRSHPVHHSDKQARPVGHGLMKLGRHPEAGQSQPCLSDLDGWIDGGPWLTGD
jgi:hypothetical protein